MSYGPVNPAPSFLPTTEVFPEDNSQFLIKQTSVYSNIANSMNIREVAIYDLRQLSTGQRFFNPSDVQNLRQGFRNVFSIGTIAPGATLTTAHGISGIVSCTRIYGTCITSLGDFRPIPYADTGNVTNQISIRVTSSNIIITNGATAPEITSGIIVLEYLLS